MVAIVLYHHFQISIESPITYQLINTENFVDKKYIKLTSQPYYQPYDLSIIHTADEAYYWSYDIMVS